MSRETTEAYFRGLNMQEVPCYKGIPMLCDKGLHEIVAEVAKETLKSGQQVLDVGCGYGALALRMHDLGFNVDALDQFDLCLCKGEINFICASAESARFTHAYDCIFMVELLEHVEFPIGVLRKHVTHLKDNGYLVITTPNVDCDYSRAWFLLTGRHWYFENARVTNDGHITPIHGYQIEYICEELNLTLVRKVGVFRYERTRPGILWCILALLRLHQLVGRVEKNEGRISLYVLQKRREADTS